MKTRTIYTGKCMVCGVELQTCESPYCEKCKKLKDKQ